MFTRLVIGFCALIATLTSDSLGQTASPASRPLDGNNIVAKVGNLIKVPITNDGSLPLALTVDGEYLTKDGQKVILRPDERITINFDAHDFASAVIGAEIVTDKSIIRGEIKIFRIGTTKRWGTKSTAPALGGVQRPDLEEMTLIKFNLR